MSETPRPFMYGIKCPNGDPYMAEICVDCSADTLHEIIEDHELEGYEVVALYLHPLPSKQD